MGTPKGLKKEWYDKPKDERVRGPSWNSNCSKYGHMAECLDVREIKYKLKHGVDVNEKDESGNTALMRHCSGGRFACVEFLIECGADVNCTTAGYVTALFYACINDHVDVVRLLLKNGANISGHEITFNQEIQSILDEWELHSSVGEAGPDMALSSI